VPVQELYRYCEIAREMLKGKYGVGRVIARPFLGAVGGGDHEQVALPAPPQGGRQKTAAFRTQGRQPRPVMALKDPAKPHLRAGKRDDVEVFFVADHTVLGDVFVFLRLQPGSEGADVADVFVDGVLGFFLCIYVIFV